MRRIILFLAIGVLSVSCSSDDGFNDANVNAAKKHVKKFTTYKSGETWVGTVNYDEANRVSSVSDGVQTRYFTFDQNNKLNKISGGGSNILTSEVIGEIHKAYEIGDVLQYDSKGNPTVLELYGYDYWGDRIISTATLSYDDKPFTFYYTLDAAGIIDVLNNTRLNFNSDPFVTSEIIMAKLLLPVNNPTKAIVKNKNNIEVSSIVVNYTYDEDKYPTSALVILTEDGVTENYSVVYEYKE